MYTNTLSQYNPYTGKLLDYLNPEYLLETYQNHGAVMCQLLHLHPMVENMTVMASVVIILYQCIMYEIGRFLFHGNRAKSTLMLAFLWLLNFFSFNLFTAAEFLIIRPSEGKTILARSDYSGAAVLLPEDAFESGRENVVGLLVSGHPRLLWAEYVLYLYDSV